MKHLRRTEQCAKGTWRVDTNPHEIPRGYDVEKHRKLDKTIARPGDLSAIASGRLRIMACHETDASLGFVLCARPVACNRGMAICTEQGQPLYRIIAFDYGFHHSHCATDGAVFPPVSEPVVDLKEWDKILPTTRARSAKQGNHLTAGSVSVFPLAGSLLSTILLCFSRQALALAHFRPAAICLPDAFNARIGIPLFRKLVTARLAATRTAIPQFTVRAERVEFFNQTAFRTLFDGKLIERESGIRAPSHCIGWLMNQLGPGNNIALRLSMLGCEDIGKIVLHGEQHKCFEDTLPQD